MSRSIGQPLFLLGVALWVGWRVASAGAGEPVAAFDFENEPGPAWSQTKRTTSPDGRRRMLGPFIGEAVYLNLNGLPEHTQIRLRFTLITAGPWGADSQQSIFNCLSAAFGKLVGGALSNQPTSNNTRAGEARLGLDHDVAPRTGAIAINSLGYDPARGGQSTYAFDIIFAHRRPTLRLTFTAQNLPQGATWAIDDVRITALTEADRIHLADHDAAQIWDRLGLINQDEAIQSLRRLVRAGPQGLRQIADHLQRAQGNRQEQVDQLISRLDDDAWVVRHEATEELKILGSSILDRLEQARQSARSPEVRMRIERIIRATQNQQLTGAAAFRAGLLWRWLELLDSPGAVVAMRQLADAVDQGPLSEALRQQSANYQAERLSYYGRWSSVALCGGKLADAHYMLTEQLRWAEAFAPSQIERARVLLGLVESRQAARARADVLLESEAAGTLGAGQRRRLLWLLITELDDPDSARRIVDASAEPQTAQALALLETASDSMSPAKQMDLAQWRQAMADQSISRYGRAMMLAFALDRYEQVIASDRASGAQRHAATEQADRLAEQLEAMGTVAEVTARSGRSLLGNITGTNLIDAPQDMADGQLAGSTWQFPRNWLVIGPFENAERKHQDTAFPPEKQIDPAAEYKGKDGKAIQWEPIAAAHPHIVPPDATTQAIYYGYTEIWSPETRQALLATGGDDTCKLWINGALAWESAKVDKAWKPDEQVMTVPLRRGLNRLLYRVENGPGAVGFSVMIAKPADAPIKPNKGS